MANFCPAGQEIKLERVNHRLISKLSYVWLEYVHFHNVFLIATSELRTSKTTNCNAITLVSWFVGLLVCWFRCFSLLIWVSEFLAALVSWFLGFNVSQFQRFKFSKIQKPFNACANVYHVLPHVHLMCV